MKKILIFGNSGSGKSTLAKKYSERFHLVHLDLDTIAWDEPGVRKNQLASELLLKQFCDEHSGWVIEGCYASLISIATKSADKLIFLNVGLENCLENCRSRAWEPHKYESKRQQDENLPMLLEWVAEYESRSGEFSQVVHQTIFDTFERDKVEVTDLNYTLPD